MIEFEKIKLGSKLLNEKARGMTHFYKAAIGHLPCEACGGNTYVTYTEEEGSYVKMHWKYCCPEFEITVTKKLDAYYS